ncbi:MAG: ATP-binding protein [Ignavibacteria bacterium]
MKTVTKEIRSSRSNIKEIEKLLLSVNEEFKLPEEQLNNVMIAVSELLLNAIVHGNKQDEKKLVKFAVGYDDKIMKISIMDEGNGFDETKMNDPTSEENLLKTSGRGMFIVKSLVDDFSYKKTKEGFEIILTVKKKS